MATEKLAPVQSAPVASTETHVQKLREPESNQRHKKKSKKLNLKKKLDDIKVPELDLDYGKSSEFDLVQRRFPSQEFIETTATNMISSKTPDNFELHNTFHDDSSLIIALTSAKQENIYLRQRLQESEARAHRYLQGAKAARRKQKEAYEQTSASLNQLEQLQLEKRTLHNEFTHTNNADKKMYSMLQTNHDTLRKENTQYQEQIQSLQKEIDELKQNNTSLHIQTKELETKLQNKTDILDQTKEELQTKIEEIHTLHKTHEQQKKTLQSENNNLSDELNKRHIETIQWKERVTCTTNEMESIRNELYQLQSSYNTLNIQQKDTESSLVEANNTIQNYTQLLDESKQTEQTLSVQIEQLQQQIEQQQTEIKELSFTNVQQQRQKSLMRVVTQNIVLNTDHMTDTLHLQMAWNQWKQFHQTKKMESDTQKTLDRYARLYRILRRNVLQVWIVQRKYRIMQGFYQFCMAALRKNRSYANVSYSRQLAVQRMAQLWNKLDFSQIQTRNMKQTAFLRWVSQVKSQMRESSIRADALHRLPYTSDQSSTASLIQASYAEPSSTSMIRAAPVQSSSTSMIRAAPVQSSSTSMIRTAPVQSSSTSMIRAAPVQSSMTSMIRAAPVQSSTASMIRTAPVQPTMQSSTLSREQTSYVQPMIPSSTSSREQASSIQPTIRSSTSSKVQAPTAHSRNKDSDPSDSHEIETSTRNVPYANGSHTQQNKRKKNHSVSWTPDIQPESKIQKEQEHYLDNNIWDQDIDETIHSQDIDGTNHSQTIDKTVQNEDIDETAQNQAIKETAQNQAIDETNHSQSMRIPSMVKTSPRREKDLPNDQPTKSSIKQNVTGISTQSQTLSSNRNSPMRQSYQRPLKKSVESKKLVKLSTKGKSQPPQERTYIKQTDQDFVTSKTSRNRRQCNECNMRIPPWYPNGQITNNTIVRLSKPTNKPQKTKSLPKYSRHRYPGCQRKNESQNIHRYSHTTCSFQDKHRSHSLSALRQSNQTEMERNLNDAFQNKGNKSTQRKISIPTQTTIFVNPSKQTIGTHVQTRHGVSLVKTKTKRVSDRGTKARAFNSQTAHDQQTRIPMQTKQTDREDGTFKNATDTQRSNRANKSESPKIENGTNKSEGTHNEDGTNKANHTHKENGKNKSEGTHKENGTNKAKHTHNENDAMQLRNGPNQTEGDKIDQTQTTEYIKQSLEEADQENQRDLLELSKKMNIETDSPLYGLLKQILPCATHLNTCKDDTTHCICLLRALITNATEIIRSDNSTIKSTLDYIPSKNSKRSGHLTSGRGLGTKKNKDHSTLSTGTASDEPLNCDIQFAHVQSTVLLWALLCRKPIRKIYRWKKTKNPFSSIPESIKCLVLLNQQLSQLKFDCQNLVLDKTALQAQCQQISCKINDCQANCIHLFSLLLCILSEIVYTFATSPLGDIHYANDSFEETKVYLIQECFIIPAIDGILQSFVNILYQFPISLDQKCAYCPEMKYHTWMDICSSEFMRHLLGEVVIILKDEKFATQTIRSSEAKTDVQSNFQDAITTSPIIEIMQTVQPSKQSNKDENDKIGPTMERWDTIVRQICTTCGSNDEILLDTISNSVESHGTDSTCCLKMMEKIVRLLNQTSNTSMSSELSDTRGQSVRVMLCGLMLRCTLQKYFSS